MNSFIYTISSQDRINDKNTLPMWYDIDFGGFGISHSSSTKYFCEVIQLTLSGSVAQDLGFIILCAKDLHTGGYFSQRPSNECILCTVGTNEDILSTSLGSSFIVDDCQTKKRVRLEFYDSNFALLAVGDVDDAAGAGEIHVLGIETEWILTLRMTPMEN